MGVSPRIAIWCPQQEAREFADPEPVTEPLTLLLCAAPTTSKNRQHKYSTNSKPQSPVCESCANPPRYFSSRIANIRTLITSLLRAHASNLTADPDKQALSSTEQNSMYGNYNKIGKLFLDSDDDSQDLPNLCVNMRSRRQQCRGMHSLSCAGSFRSNCHATCMRRCCLQRIPAA